MKTRTRILIWICFTGAVLLVLGVKSWHLEWWQTKPPLELNDQPAVLVFVKNRYICECEAIVNSNARSQALNWPADARGHVPLHMIDIEQRADLAKRFQVIRAPAMLLLDSEGNVSWRQDGVTTSTSDDFPLDLRQIENHIADMDQGP